LAHVLAQQNYAEELL